MVDGRGLRLGFESPAFHQARYIHICTVTSEEGFYDYRTSISRGCFVPIRFCVSGGNIFGGQHSELMEEYNMRSNKWNLITALLYVTAGICFIFAAIFQTETPSKVLYSIAAVCFLIGGIGFSCTYAKKRKRNAK